MTSPADWSTVVTSSDGLLGIIDKVFITWRAVSRAKNFGKDVAEHLVTIEMEYFRFQAWWTVLESIREDLLPQRRAGSTRIVPTLQRHATSDLQRKLEEGMTSPILSAASVFLAGLQEIEETLQKLGCLDSIGASSSDPDIQNSAPRVGTGFDAVERISSRRKRRARDLVRGTSFYQRLTHQTKPWGVADNDHIKDVIDRLIYSNNFLYGILPQRVRDSLLEQSLIGYILGEEGISKTAPIFSEMLKQKKALVPLRQNMALFLRHEATESKQLGVNIQEEVQKMLLPIKQLVQPVRYQDRWSLQRYKATANGQNITPYHLHLIKAKVFNDSFRKHSGSS